MKTQLQYCVTYNDTVTNSQCVNSISNNSSATWIN